MGSRRFFIPRWSRCGTMRTRLTTRLRLPYRVPPVGMNDYSGGQRHRRKNC